MVIGEFKGLRGSWTEMGQKTQLKHINEEPEPDPEPEPEPEMDIEPEPEPQIPISKDPLYWFKPKNYSFAKNIWYNS